VTLIDYKKAGKSVGALEV